MASIRVLVDGGGGGGWGEVGGVEGGWLNACPRCARENYPLMMDCGSKSKQIERSAEGRCMGRWMDG